MERTPDDILKSVFGYPAFRGQQADIIAHVTAGGSCCVLMPTGSGKSLCYQIPAIARQGTGIVVSPLIALMDDQVAALRELGVRAACIHSGLGPEGTRDAYNALRDGALDLVYVAPERLVTDDFLYLLDNIDIALFAIDEAHCLSQWGHDFRPEYRQLTILRERFPYVPCIAVTATADEPTRKDIMERLHLPALYTGGFDRPNIHYTVSVKENARTQLLRFLKGRSPDESGIVYCLSRKKVEETARFLNDSGYRALPYHAGLDSTVRAKNQERFLREDGIIMTATIAFGMGINKPDVRFVAHLDLPKNVEAYYQETGRAGRDGLPSVAWMVYGMQDVVLQRGMIEKGEAPEAQKRVERHKLNAFLSFCETARCRRQVLLEYFGDRGEPCGNCDTCLHPPKTIDATVAAQKILSCIYRTGQMFGSAYIIDLLLGKNNERVEKFGHDKLSTFGIGQEFSAKEWQSLIRQMISHNLLAVHVDSHGEIVITEKGAAFLKEKQTIELRMDERMVRERTTDALRRSAASAALESEADQSLFAALKTLRMELAKEQGVPPYIVFNDKTLIDMVLIKPGDRDQMAMVSGVGMSKLEKYGDTFLHAIREHQARAA
jgi:ATP-dependent DNA helicase RecQ